MPTVQTTTLLRIIGFSALAGARALSPAALLSLYLAQRPSPPDQWLAQRLNSTTGTIITSTLALGELVGDKLPLTPDRMAAPALAGRVLIGGGTGVLLGMLHNQPAWLSAIGGGVAAAASTFVTFHLRRALGQALGVPDPLIGLLEDGVVLSSGWWLLTSLDAAPPQNA